MIAASHRTPVAAMQRVAAVPRPRLARSAVARSVRLAVGARGPASPPPWRHLVTIPPSPPAPSADEVCGWCAQVPAIVANATAAVHPHDLEQALLEAEREMRRSGSSSAAVEQAMREGRAQARCGRPRAEI